MNEKAVILGTWHSPYARLKPISIGSISLKEGFWKARLQSNRDVTLPTQFALLESTGRLENFRRVAGESNHPYKGYVFNDSDVYKWLEAASWALVIQNDDQLKPLLDGVITLISKAQDKNGYINTYFSLERAAERWTNLREKHELYCAGHLIQAAVAHHRVTDDDRLLNIAIRLADHIWSTFGPSGIVGTCGHPEIEMALVELFRATGDEKYLNLAQLFIDRRGHGLLGGGEYLIDHQPFGDLPHLAGHAVRALYLCSGIADVVLETGDRQLRETLERLWSNLVAQQIYITGGVGARHDGEAFGLPYELPNSMAYAETCAAIANVMWNWRMLQPDGDARFADLLEWALNNAVLPGISVDARQYFYVNPLSDDGQHRRADWFDCACCPPNISRTIAMFPGYMYSISKEGIWANLYAASMAQIQMLTGETVTIAQDTAYPWDGTITFTIMSVDRVTKRLDTSTHPLEFSLFLRVPGWVNGGFVDVEINDEKYPCSVNPGEYLEIHRLWQRGDKLGINLPMDVNFIESHPLVVENTGRIAVTRGPLLYCSEEVDNAGVVLPQVTVNLSDPLNISYDPHLLGGTTKIQLDGNVTSLDLGWKNKLYRHANLANKAQDGRKYSLTLIPYYAWGNRKPGSMQIWHLVN